MNIQFGNMFIEASHGSSLIGIGRWMLFIAHAPDETRGKFFRWRGKGRGRYGNVGPIMWVLGSEARRPKPVHPAS